MTLQRFLLGFTTVLVLQSSVFAWQYQDLLYFRQTVAAIRADQPESFVTHAQTALSRQKAHAPAPGHDRRGRGWVWQA